MKKSTYKVLVEKALIYHPVHGMGFSNHVPMLLTALDAMGGSKQQLHDYFSKSIFKKIEIEKNQLNQRETLSEILMF